MIYLPPAHQESSCLPPALPLLQLASGDMLHTATSVLSTLHWSPSQNPALEFRAWVVKSKVACLSNSLIQQEHKEPATLVCTLESLKELCSGFCSVQVKVHTLIWGLRIRHRQAWSLQYCSMYRPKGCFPSVFWFAWKHAVKTNPEFRESSSRWDVTQW